MSAVNPGEGYGTLNFELYHYVITLLLSLLNLCSQLIFGHMIGHVSLEVKMSEF